MGDTSLVTQPAAPTASVGVQSDFICGYLEENARRSPARVAVADSYGAAATYAELDDRAARIAGFLVRLGVRPGDRVGVALPKTTAAFTLLFGIMKARAAYVPVEWNGPAERTRAILTSCQVRIAFVDPRSTGFEGSADIVISLDSTKWESMLQENEQLEIDPAERSPDDIAYILYTSGSTGAPKGAMVTQRNATSYIDWCAETFGAREEDKFGNHAPFYFAMCILDIFVPIKVGGEAHLVSEELGKNPRELARFISERKLTVWYSTPAILGLLAEFGDLGRVECSLRAVLFAGEPFQIKKLRRLQELWPKPDYYNLWGSTETNACTYARIAKPIPEDRTEPYPIGKAGSHCLAMVLDDEAKPVPPGQEGLLYLTGASVFKGYWGRETVFLERDGHTWHNTGDVVRDLGEEGFAYVGRRDRMVKRRGFRIELGEIERALYRHPAISEAAVIAAPDSQADLRLVAHLVVPHDAKPSIVEMKTFCNEHLPSFMNPDIFIFKHALPRTRSNKVDYQALIRNPF